MSYANSLARSLNALSKSESSLSKSVMSSRNGPVSSTNSLPEEESSSSPEFPAAIGVLSGRTPRPRPLPRWAAGARGGAGGGATTW